MEVHQDILFVQFLGEYLIGLFYETNFEIFSLNDENASNKIMGKPYNVPRHFSLLAVPESIDQTVNIFFEEKNEKSKTFGLWCVEMNLLTESIRLNSAYKIYDIMNSLKSILVL
jgi:hypothetical protein